MVAEVNTSLSRYGIVHNDIFRGVNDTTNSATLAGRLLQCTNTFVLGVEGRRTCSMHTNDLVTKHATGMVVRKVNNVISDSFDALQAMVKEVKDAGSYLMEKRAKNRWANFVRVGKMVGFTATKIELPNKTRVSGLYRMLISFLRNRRLIQMSAGDPYFAKDFEEKGLILSTETWQDFAEVEAVLYHANVLAMETQREDEGHIAFSWYEIALARFRLRTSRQFEVIDTNAAVATEKPRRVPVKRENLQPIAKKLLVRMDNEYERYYTKPDTDQVVAAFSHPVMVAMGVKLLRVIDRDNFGYQEQLEELRQNLVDFTTSLYWDGLRRQHMNITTTPETDDSEDTRAKRQRTQQQEEKENKSAPDEFWDQLMAEADEADKTIDGNGNEVQETEQDIFAKFDSEVKDEVTRFTEYCEEADWIDLVSRFKSKNYRKHFDDKEGEHELKIVKRRDPIYTGKLFDVLGWWKTVGRDKFPKLATTASIILGKPSHNGFQERVFSRGTYCDGLLTKRQTEDHFEMKVLEGINRKTTKELLTKLYDLNVKAKSTREEAKHVNAFFKQSIIVEQILTEDDIGPAVDPVGQVTTVVLGEEDKVGHGNDEELEGECDTEFMNEVLLDEELQDEVPVSPSENGLFESTV